MTRIINALMVLKKPSLKKRTQEPIWLKTRTPRDKTKLKNVNKYVKDLLENEQNEPFQNYLKNLSPNLSTNYSLQKATRKLKRIITETISHIRTTDRTWARSDWKKQKYLCNILEMYLNPTP